MENKIAMEVVHFQTNVGVTAMQLTEAAQAMLATLQSWPGFISRELVEVGDGQWIDVVHWQTAKDAMAAQEKAMQSPVCLNYFSLMQASEEQMFHGNIVLTQTQ